LLSQLFHPHVIRYHHSWIELGKNQTNDSSSFPSSSENLSSSSSSSSSCSMMEHDGQSIYLCYQMEYCPMSLESYLQEQRSLWFSSNQEHQIRTRTLDLYYQVQIMNGFRYLHENGIIHGDIKPSNLLIQQNHCIKIADFGFSVIVTRTDDSVYDDTNSDVNPSMLGGGTTMYASPEMLCRKTERRTPLLTFASDVFSVGLVCVEMNELFRTQMEKSRTFHNIRRGDFSPYYKFFLSKMLFSSMLCAESQRVSFTYCGSIFQSIYQSYRESESVLSAIVSQITSSLNKS